MANFEAFQWVFLSTTNCLFLNCLNTYTQVPVYMYISTYLYVLTVLAFITYKSVLLLATFPSYLLLSLINVGLVGF